MSTEVTLIEKLQSAEDLAQRSQTRGPQAATTWTSKYLHHRLRGSAALL